MGVLNTDPKLWVTGDLIDATTLNAQIRDPFTALQSAWTSYTPTVTGTVSNPSGWTTTQGYYHRWGKTVFGKFYVVPSAGFTAGSGAYQFAAPVQANMGQSAQVMCGEAFFFDSSAAILYVGRLRLQPPVTVGAASSFVIILTGTSYYVGTGGPVVPATSDQMGGCFRYEAAQ